MKCLYCGLEAIVKETYQGIEIRVCSEGHRTGLYQELKQESISFQKVA